MKNEKRYIPARELRVATAADGSKTISGYAVVFNSPSVDMGFTEIVSPGALNYDDVLCLRDHDTTILLGRTKSGTLTLSEDGIGLRFTCKLPKTTQADDLAVSLERGDISGCSFGFCVDDNGDTWTTDGKGGLLRTLKSVQLFEISVCSFPAYEGTSVSVRSCPPELRAFLKQMNKRSNDVGCNCGCDACLDDDCENCEDSECDDSECAEHGCPFQMGDTGDEGRALRLILALRK